MTRIMGRIQWIRIAIVVLTVLASGIAAAQHLSEPEAALADVRSLRMQGRLTEAMTAMDSLVADVNGRDDVPEWLRCTVMRKRDILVQVQAMSADDLGRVMRADSLEQSIEVATNVGRFEGLLEMSASLVELRRQVWGLDHEETGYALGWQGLTYMSAIRISEAELVLEDAIRIARAMCGGEHPWLAGLLSAMGQCQGQQGRFERQLELETIALEMRKGCRQPDHPSVGWAHRSMSNILLSLDDNEAALAHMIEAQRIITLNYGEDHAYQVLVLSDLGKLLAWNYQELEAIAVLTKAIAVAEATLGSESIWLAEPLMELGRLVHQRWRLAEARMHFERALAITLAQGEEGSNWVVSCRNELVLIYSDQGRYTEALAQLEAVRDLLLLVNEFDDLQKSEYCYDRGNIYRSSGQYRDAIDHLTKARQHLVAEEEADFNRFVIEICLFDALVQNGDYGAADSLATIIATNTAHREFGWFEVMRGEFLFDQHRFEEALGTLTDAHSRAEEGWQSELPHFGILTLKAQCHLALGDTVQAHHLSAKAIDEYEQAESELGWNWERSTFEGGSPYRIHAAISLLLGRSDEAWQTLLGSVSRNLYRLMYLADALDSHPELQVRLKSLASEMARARQRLDRDRTGTRGVGDPDVGEKIAANEVVMRRAAADLGALQDSLRTIGFEAIVERPDAASVASSIPEEAALIGWLSVELRPGVRANWGYSVRRDAAPVFVRLDDPSDTTSAAAQWDAVTRYRDDLHTASSWPTRMDLSEAVLADAGAVYHSWLEPLMPMIGDARSLIVIPSAPLLGVPVETVIDGNGNYLNDRFTINYTPSAAIHVLLTNRERQSGRHGWQRSLVLGDPALATGQADDVVIATRGPAEDKDPDYASHAIATRDLREAAAGSVPALSELPRLPRARQEVIGISSLLPGVVLETGPEASEQLIYSLANDDELKEFDVVHFAAHALLDDQSPDHSAIVLSQVDLPDAGAAYLAGERIYDGLLSAEEISRDLVLNADLVTLSACQTGLGRAATDEGYLGLTKAFFRAGARCVLASMWKVADHPTELLMRRFYENAMGSPDMSKVQALQEARRWLRTSEREDGTRPYEHPVYWGGFVLTGLSD